MLSRDRITTVVILSRDTITIPVTEYNYPFSLHWYYLFYC